MSHVTSRAGGTITVKPRDASKQSGLVVICHGLGHTAEGFADVAEHMASQMPHLKFILPTAPTRPVTMNMGMPMPAWYDITGLDERSNENCPGIQASVQTVAEILRMEHETTGLPYSRMLLAGFSMGGALGLFAGMGLPLERKLAGIVVMSGYLAAAKHFRLTPGLEDTPVFHGHGTADPLVRYELALKSREYMLQHGAKNYQVKGYKGMQHTVIPEEIADVLNFLKRVLPPDDNCKVKLKAPEEMTVKELKQAILDAGLREKALGFMEKHEFVKLLRDHRDGLN